MKLYEVKLEYNYIDEDYNRSCYEDMVGCFKTIEEAEKAKEILIDFVKTHCDNPIYEGGDRGNEDIFYYTYIEIIEPETLEVFKRFLEEDYIENFEY